MKRGAVAIVVACALALSACGGEVGSPPIETVTPTPWPGDPIERSTLSPSATPIPSQAELSARAEVVYRAFFDEWMRLERAGGADQPTQILLDNGAEEYLDAVVAFLRDQKRSGYTVQGPMPIVTVVPAPGGTASNIDPRYTLRVCEDGRAGTFTDHTGTHQSGLLEGTVYFREIDGRLKVVAAENNEVEKCAL